MVPSGSSAASAARVWHPTSLQGSSATLRCPRDKAASMAQPDVMRPGMRAKPTGPSLPPGSPGISGGCGRSACGSPRRRVASFSALRVYQAKIPHPRSVLHFMHYMGRFRLRCLPYRLRHGLGFSSGRDRPA